MTRVCALANRVGGRHLEPFLALERSLERKEIPFLFNLESGKWRWQRRVEWELEVAERYPDDYLVFVDAFDYLFVGEKNELEQVVRSAPLIFSCDSGEVPWPIPEFADEYDKRRPRLSPWCWLNGSGPTGLGREIAKAAKWGLHRLEFREPGTDQTFWTQVYLAGGFGELDQLCRLTQVLYDASQPDFVTPHLALKGGRLVNMVTLSKPQFIHATGHSWSAIPKELL